jgi:hypothetical protein
LEIAGRCFDSKMVTFKLKEDLFEDKKITFKPSETLLKSKTVFDKRETINFESLGVIPPSSESQIVRISPQFIAKVCHSDEGGITQVARQTIQFTFP